MVVSIETLSPWSPESDSSSSSRPTRLGPMPFRPHTRRLPHDQVAIGIVNCSQGSVRVCLPRRVDQRPDQPATRNVNAINHLAIRKILGFPCRVSFTRSGRARRPKGGRYPAGVVTSMSYEWSAPGQPSSISRRHSSNSSVTRQTRRSNQHLTAFCCRGVRGCFIKSTADLQLALSAAGVNLPPAPEKQLPAKRQISWSASIQ